MNRLNLMDCMEGMSKFPDKYFELAIVDPPYGIGVSKQDNSKRGKLGSHYSKKEWDIIIPEKKYFDELFRVSKNQIIWGGNYFIENLKNTSCFIVWDKKTVGYTADCELAWSSFRTAVRKFDFMWEGFWQENMKQKEIRIHPTQKPVALYRWLLQNYAKKGDKILDTHVGSGSSLIACWEEGFEYCGFELDEDYYKAACNRIEEVQAQGRLFTTV